MKKFRVLLVFAILLLIGCSTEKIDNKNEKNSEVALKKVDFLLDWVPNTNHTGLFVAKEKGYFAEEGIKLDIKQPANESTSALIINNKAPMGIYFQDYLATKLSKGAGITAIAAIIENNTSGIISNRKYKVKNPKNLEGLSYGTWDDPIELAMLKIIIENQNGDFSKIKKIPNGDDNSITSIANGVFDSANVYYAWDKIMADHLNIETNFFYYKDYAEELNFYSPIIIANNEYLRNNADEAKKILRAIKKGYQYAMDNPVEAADILIKNAPELENKRDFIIDSQKYLAKEYASDKDKWGYIDAKRWNKFYNWLNSNNLLKNPIPENTGFSNDYLN